MEWALLYLMPCLVSIVPAVVFREFAIVFGVALIWGAVLFLLIKSDMFDPEYKKWVKKGCPGDHPWFEWQRCKESYAQAMAAYSDKTYCKIGFGSFEKYFHVNPSRYTLKRGYVVFDDEDASTEIRMVFPRRELWKYYRFRRYYKQSRQMVSVLGFVRADIELARDEAVAQIEKAREMMPSDFQGITLK